MYFNYKSSYQPTLSISSMKLIMFGLKRLRFFMILIVIGMLIYHLVAKEENAENSAFLICKTQILCIYLGYFIKKIYVLGSWQSGYESVHQTSKIYLWTYIKHN